MGNRKGISSATRDALWGKAAGYCQKCSKPLFEGGAYRTSGNYSNIAHIHAYSENGPRFNEKLSENDRNSIENLMLLCPQCHKTIDDNEATYTADVLRSIKSRREEYVTKVMRASKPQSAYVITVTCPIHGNATEISRSEWSQAMASSGMVHAGDTEIRVMDSNATSGSIAYDCSLLARKINSLRLTMDPTVPLAIFAIAPQPILIALGSLIGDKQQITVFQKQRDTDSWCWHDEECRSSFQHDAVPSSDSAEVALVLSVSGTISKETLPAEVTSSGMPILELRAANPSVYIARTQEDVRAFEREAISLLDEVHSAMPHVAKVHIFPALPVSMAVTLGGLFNRNLLTKAVVYEKTDGRFSQSIEIGGSDD